jgi:hypothetical protein
VPSAGFSLCSNQDTLNCKNKLTKVFHSSQNKILNYTECLENVNIFILRISTHILLVYLNLIRISVVRHTFNTFLKWYWKFERSRDSVVGIATGYGLNDRGVGVRVAVGLRIFSSPRRPDRLWCLPNLLSNGYRGIFPQGQS